MIATDLSGGVAIHSVLVATDFSAASVKAQRHGISIARHFQSRFYLAHIVSSVGLNMVAADAREDAMKITLREMTDLEYAMEQNGSLQGLSHEFILGRGDVWTELQAVIRRHQIDLIVIGTHARHGIEKMILGSVAEKIIREADQLVLTVGPQSGSDASLVSTEGVLTFLFPTNFGASSLKALPHAISFCNHFRAKLVLLHVAPSSRLVAAGLILEEQKIPPREIHTRLRNLIPANALSVAPEFMVALGDRGEQILHAAHSLPADLIIMGLDHANHGRAAAHLPATTTYNVICQARCAVLTVRN